MTQLQSSQNQDFDSSFHQDKVVACFVKLSDARITQYLEEKHIIHNMHACLDILDTNLIPLLLQTAAMAGKRDSSPVTTTNFFPSL